MLSKEFKLEILKMLNEKSDLDEEIAAINEKAREFNALVKKLTGKDQLDYHGLVRMLCEEHND